MVIVMGTFQVEPAQREQFLAARGEAMRRSRAEEGCLEYTFAADPLDPARVVLLERWASQEALDAHLAAPRPPSTSSGPSVEALSTTIRVYDAARERPLQG